MHASEPSKHTTGSRMIAGIGFAVLFVIGAVFLYSLGNEVSLILKTKNWTQTECEILKSEIEETHSGINPYRLMLEYRYSYKEKNYQSSRFTFRDLESGDYGLLDSIRKNLSPGSKTSCWVNPQKPEEAILSHRSLAISFLLIVPLTFILFSIYGIYSIWNTRHQSPPLKALSHTGGTKSQPSTLVFALLSLLALALTYVFTVRPITEFLEARHWPQATCSIIESQVRTAAKTKAITGAVDIVYEFSFKGHTYRSNRYSFIGGTSASGEALEKIVARYTPGSTTSCYINPHAPTQSVLERGWTDAMYFTYIPLVFLLISLVGFGAVTRKTSGAVKRGKRSSRLKSTTIEQGDLKVLLLQPDNSLGRTFLASVAICIIWNLIVSAFAFQAWTEWASGNADYVVMIFLIPFILIGAALLALVAYHGLLLFNPVPLLTIEPAPLRLGDSKTLSWKMKGHKKSVSELQISFRGTEEIKYTRGTTQYLEKHIFHNQSLVTAKAADEISSGSVTFEIPKNSMHSFNSGNNKIVWSIIISGVIHRWPDIDLEYAVKVRHAKTK